MSILIRTGGLSFYIPTTDEGVKQVHANSLSCADVSGVINDIKQNNTLSENVKVTFFHDRFIVIPTELYIKENINLYFSLKGIDINFEEDYIITSHNETSTYIWLYKRELIDLLNTQFENVVYSHILDTSQLAGYKLQEKFKNSLYIFSKEDDLLAITIFKDKKLIFQDIVEAKTPSDTSFYIKSILANNSFNRKDNIISIGNHDEKFNKILSNFSRTIASVDISELI